MTHVTKNFEWGLYRSIFEVQGILLTIQFSTQCNKYYLKDKHLHRDTRSFLREQYCVIIRKVRSVINIRRRLVRDL